MSYHHTINRLEQNNTGSGRFLFINDVLCKTDDSDGEFVPSDIFGLLADLPSKEPAVTLIDLNKSSENFSASSEHSAHSFTSPRLGNKRICNCNYNNNDDGEGNSQANSNLTNYELDSSVFNVFGVLSCGVLLDNAAGKFVDAASHNTFKPFLLSPHAGHQNSKSGSSDNDNKKTTINDTLVYECAKQDSHCKEYKETQKAAHQFCEQNTRAYCNGMFCAIRAENALTYCSSMKPLLVEQGKNLANYERDISNIENGNSISAEHVAKKPIVSERRTNNYKQKRKKQDIRNSRGVVKEQLYEYMIFAKHMSKCEDSSSTKKQHQSSLQSLFSPSSSHDSSHMEHENDRIATEFFRRWRKSEKYRLNCHHHYNNGNCNNHKSSVFLPSFIPYRFQHRGKVIAPSYSLPHAFAIKENREYEDKSEYVEIENVSNNAELFKTGSVTTATAVVNDCTDKEHSAIMCNASFLSGRSLFARGMYSTPRNDVSLWRHGSYSPLYFWEFFKPYNTDASIDYNIYLQNKQEEEETYNSLESNKCVEDALDRSIYNEEHFKNGDSCLNKLSVLSTQEQKTNISDVIEYMSDFAAPKSKSMYSRAWRIFTLYFHHLGIVTELVKRDELNSDNKVENNAAQYRYSLCPNELYHVEKEVKEKQYRSVVNVSRTTEAKITNDDDDDNDIDEHIFQLTSKITAQADKADAWDALLQSSRIELLRRIACIEQYMTSKTFVTY